MHVYSCGVFKITEPDFIPRYIYFLQMFFLNETTVWIQDKKAVDGLQFIILLTILFLSAVQLALRFLTYLGKKLCTSFSTILYNFVDEGFFDKSKLCTKISDLHLQLSIRLNLLPIYVVMHFVGVFIVDHFVLGIGSSTIKVFSYSHSLIL